MIAILRLALGLALALPMAVTAEAQQACQAIAEQARRYEPPTDGTFLFPLQGLDQVPGSVVHLAQKQSAPPSAIEAFLARLGPTSQPRGPSNDESAWWQIGQGLYALESRGGTAHCAGFSFFEADADGQATIVEQPPAARSRDGGMYLCSGAGSEGLVGTVRGEPAFFLQEGMDQNFEIGVTLWRNKAWQPECKLSIRFDAAFSIGKRSCNGVDCEAAANAGLALAKRFDNNPKLQEQEEAKLTPAERETFRKMIPRRPEGLPPFAEKELPTFGSKAQLHDFGCEEGLLPVKIGGQLYLGRLGHGSIGWRCFNDFVFALYAVKDGEPVPVAGIAIDKVRAAPVEATVK